MKNDRETRENLLKCAKQEFLEKGYLQASLRNICKKAGVTTGAFYFFFQDKEDLFANLVQEPLDSIYRIMSGHYNQEMEYPAEMLNKLEDFGNDDRDRKMTIMTTTFVPCGAKLPIIALIAGAFFGNAGWVSWSAYFVGVAAIVCSGIILKKTKMFAGDPAPFVMELPAYHWPTIGNVLRNMWVRGWSFIKKAGTIILLSTIVLWFLMSFGWTDGGFGMLEAEQLNESILAKIGNAIAWIFAPLGWTQAGEGWKMAVAAVTGLIAKENVVATFGLLFGYAEVAEDGAEIWGNLASVMTPIASYGFLVFNLLCAPCFAAMGAIKREMNNAKWFWFAIGYQCVLAYVVAMCIYQIGTLITTGVFGVGTVVAFLFVIGLLYLLFRPYRESRTLSADIKGMIKTK